jgi:serine/threonine protein kinase
MGSTSNWTTVAESNFPWERDALEFVRQRFPTHEPYRAWSNFEFIADDGSINEVDVLVFTPQGFFLIEIKSRPGRLFGDAGTWTWETDGRPITTDNPLIAANTKAKKLNALLQRQKACKNKGSLPFLEALVFCSAPDLRCELQDTARYRVCLRDREQDGDTPARYGITAAIKDRRCPGLDPHPRGTHNRPTAKTLSQAMEQAGIRPSQRRRKVSDYALDQVIEEGPGYQDRLATHVQFPDAKRRVRLYLVRTGASEEDRQIIRRAAQREFQLLETLQHPGILRTHGFTEHELGPALIFEHEPLSIRLDHYLVQRKDSLGVDIRLDLMRQIAEVIRFAHDKKVVHRSLCPQSILITAPASSRPRIKVFNWQVGYRTGSTSSGVSREVSATSHVDRLVEDASTAYMAPEAVSDEGSVGEHLDVFSLGAIAYHLFSGVAPATNGLELSNKLRETKGLQMSSVLNGAGENLQFLIQYSTHPEVTSRIDSVGDFLSCLDDVEDDLTAPEQSFIEDPTRAQKGDRLPGNLTVLRRLGQGACSVALLVERNGQEFVLKAASNPEHNQRLKDESEVLQKLRHQHIVEYYGTLVIGDRTCVLMRRAGQETLGQRLRKEGRLHLDLLQRFGEDLLDVINYLEEQGIPHRDIKPDNIGVGPVGRGDRLHLVLFDFSLSRTPPDNIYAGTTSYLDPLLPLRKPPQWDLHAERYAAAVTLYELATGMLPKWGDGKTDPSHLDGEITIDAELFDASVRDSLSGFFQTAFRRDPRARFDNAEEMLRTWRDCFEGIEQPGPLSDHENEAELSELLADVDFDTRVPELGLGTRAVDALDRANVLTVKDLLTVPLQRLLSMRGVGNKTRREIGMAVRMLRERLGPLQPENATPIAVDTGTNAEQIDVGNLGIDLLAQRVIRVSPKEDETIRRALHMLLGLDPELKDPWPGQSDVAQVLHIARAQVGQWVSKCLNRWAKESAITKLRGDITPIIESAGGVVSLPELATATLMARGSIQDEPRRTLLATAIVRVCVEVERTMAEPRFLVRRDRDRVLVALHQELADYASRLGDEADTLADEDPLVPPARVIQRLRDISLPTGTAELTDSRLVRLAAVASQHAAVSSRQELYPRGMDAARALKLSQGALYGVRFLTVQQIHERVSSRYPEAAPLPARPALDDLLRAAGFDFQWDAVAEAAGRYVSRARETGSISSGSESISRMPTAVMPHAGEEITPEIADARQFEERLRRGVRDGSFLVLLVNPKYYQQACQELCERFPLQLIDFEGLFINALRQVATDNKVNWELVIKTDATPSNGDWDKLMRLVRLTMPRIEEQLSKADKPMLMVYAGLLARYDQMAVLERLRDKVGRRDGIRGLWLLIPGDQHAVIDGKAVPIISPGQRARIPESWLQNVHRANGDKERYA